MGDSALRHVASDPTPPVQPVGEIGSSRSAPALAPPVAPDATVISHRPPALPGAARPLPSLELGRLLIGQRLNHFELLEFVGGGGMGAVFRARDTMLNREVALKVLSRDQGSDDETRRRFQNEAQSAARLDHENIARVYYVGEDRGLNYIVFEFIEGTNLRDLVDQRGGPLPLAEAVSYTLQIAKALDHAASRDVVHRDIKPSNVLITVEGRAKLVDMGLARLHQVESGDDLTASGVTLGTFDYISPEQARDPRSADVRSDIYSLGCTLYFMLTTRPPFPDGTVLQKLLQHNSDEPPDPRQFNPEVNEEVAALLQRMLVKNPRRRYQSPGELIDDLLVLAEETGLPLSAWGLSVPTTLPSADAGWVRHLPWAAPVVVLLLAVLLLEWLPTRTAEPQVDLIDASRTEAKPPVEITPAVSITTDVNTTQSALSGRGMNAGGLPSTEASTTPTKTSGPKNETPDAPAAEAPLRPGLLVVSPTVRGSQFYASLRAACSAAKNGDVIELRYNGPREERPIAVNNRRFTIRAGESYQPVVAFRPNEPDPLRYPRSMIAVVGGRVSFLNVAFELHVPAPADLPADRWSLVEAQHCESIELQDCTLTIRNSLDQVSLHPAVAFFQVRGAPGFDSTLAIDDVAEPLHLRLENCLVRGEATFLRVDDAQPVQLAWDNGLFISTEWLALINGTEASARRENHVRLSLRHVTAALGSGACRMVNSLEEPYLPQVDVNCADSILLAPTMAPLLDQEGIDDVATFRQYVSWNGERVFYQGFDTAGLWRILDLNRADGVQRYSLADWEMHWGPQREILPAWGDIAWRHPTVTTPMWQRTTDDYALSDTVADNMARNGASDGRDVGALAYLLPK